MIEDIVIEGNKKISDGTVLNYLTVQPGDLLDTESLPRLLRELYKPGFFEEITFFKDQQALVIEVVERPSIKEVEFDGNKVLDDETLEKALDDLGIRKGKLFNPTVMNSIEQELKQLYYSMGKYSIQITTDIDDSQEGLVEINIDISEGVPAKIRDINITGNQAFSDDELLDDFSTTIPSQSFWGSADDYSKSKIAGDLEGVRSKYLDTGYLNFDINSTQVTISPDRKDMHLAVNITEGDQFSISNIDISGQLVVPKEDLMALLDFRAGDVFSRKQVTKAIQLMSKRLGEDGYAFANVNAIPDIDNDSNTVALNFVVDPGQKMVVRHIHFIGNEKTMDEVLRREMRQMESAPFSASKVDRSKVRLQRLKFIASATIKFKRVKGSPDLMDLEVEVSERFSGSFSVGAGYSQAQGALFNLSLSHDNVFGNGKQISISFDNSISRERYQFSYVNPYYTEDGISRGFSFSYGKTDASGLNISNYLLDQMILSMNYTIPLTEYNTVRINFGVQQDDLTLSDTTADEVFEFIKNNSDQYTPASLDTDVTEQLYQTGFISSSFSFDTRNRVIFPDTGYIHSISGEVYGGDLDFYKLGYRNQFVTPMSEDLTFSFKTRLGYGAGLAKTTDLPFYEKFFAGGVRTVRGYDYNSLGPEDSKQLPFGGNLQLVTNTELLLKAKSLGDPKTFRLGFFYDAGNVFSDTDTFEVSDLKSAIGISAKWFSPVGPLEFSFARAVNDEPGDSTRNFQFSLGSVF